MNTHWRSQVDMKYLGAYSLPDGKDIVGTIKKVVKEEVVGEQGAKQECIIIYFNEFEKGMVANRTNCKTIEKLYKTPYIEEWTGKKVQIGEEMVKAYGEIVPGLRIRNKIPSDKLPELTPKLQPAWDNVRKALADKKATMDQVKKKYTVSKDNETLLLKTEPAK